jgi:hypothetical protein
MIEPVDFIGVATMRQVGKKRERPMAFKLLRARTMDEFSRPATLEDLKSLLRSFHEHGADYLLIGGYALAAHGRPDHH